MEILIEIYYVWLRVPVFAQGIYSKPSYITYSWDGGVLRSLLGLSSGEKSVI